MTSKNKLQELFQKDKKSLPKYETKRVGGDDHTPLWQSTVTLHDLSSFTGDITHNKKQSESSAAEKALKHIQILDKSTSVSVEVELKNNTVSTSSKKSNITVVIDQICWSDELDEFINKYSTYFDLYIYRNMIEYSHLENVKDIEDLDPRSKTEIVFLTEDIFLYKLGTVYFDDVKIWICNTISQIKELLM